MTTTSGLVTVLFTDVVGSTEISSAIGDVAADELRRLHFDDMNEAIAAAGGTLVKTIGDAVMVTFSGAADALNCAVEMQRAVALRNRRASGQDLHIRIGVSAGDATFEEGDWFGTPVIEAARLCAAADGDQILLSTLVGALAGSRAAHEITRLGTRELKGLPVPVDVAEVEWSAGPAASGEIPLPGFVDTDPSFAFAGRVAEAEVVHRAWKDAHEGQRRLVMISGEPGVGKTRLVTEFVRTVHADGGIVLWGRCDEDLDVPYQPFAEALRLYTAAIPDDRLLAEFGPLAADLSRLVPELAVRIPGIDVVPTGSADADRLRLFETVMAAFASIAENEAVVLVLDDMHWADASSLLLLKHLLRQSQSIRLLMLGTYRDTDLDRSHPLADVLADLRREHGVERVDLGGLGVAEITSFLELAAGHELDEPGIELAVAIHRETEGNPFFLSEMVRHLAESGYIVERDGRWVSDYRLEDVGIPEGIREVVGRRLSGLTADVNTVLSIASVVGPEFDISLIEAVGGPTGDALLDALDAAVTASVVREVAGTFGRYAFAHALVRSTLYDELSTTRRVRLHWRIGTALHDRFGSAADRVDQIAHHLAEGALAGDPDLAVDACVRAAERAAADFAFEAATRWYDRALGASELGDDGDLDRRLDIEIARVGTLRDAGDVELRAAGFRAAATARRLGDPVRFGEAVVAMDGPTPTTHRDDEQIELIREALDGLGDDPSPLRARLLVMLVAQTYWTSDAEERIELGRQALEVARATGDAACLSVVLTRAWALFDMKRPSIETVTEAAEEALAISRPGTAHHMQALENLCAMNAARGDTDLALEYYERFRAQSEGARVSGFLWRAMVVSSMLAVHVGDLERAESEADAALAYANDHGSRDQALASYGSVLLYIRRAQGRSSEVAPLLAGLVESQPALPVWRIALAGCCYFSGDTETVRAQFDWLVADDFARIPADVEYPVTMCGLARVAPAIDPPRDVCASLYTALLPFAGLMNYTGTSISDANDVGLGCVAELLGRHDDADGHFRAAIDLADRARALPYSLHYRYEWARVLAARGDAERARPLLVEVAERSAGRGMDAPHGYVAWSAQLLAELDS